jgi:outer membrane protein
MKAIVGAVSVAAGIVLPASSAFAQHAPMPQTDAIIRQAVAPSGQARVPDASSPPNEQQTAAGPGLSLSLEQAVQMALEKNLDITIQRLNSQTYDLTLAGARAAFLPTVSALVGDQHQTAVPITLLTGGQQVATSTATVNGSLTQNLPRAGGSLHVTWNNNRVNTNSFFYNYDPAFNAVLSAQYTQPLFRGRRTDEARHQLVVTRANRAISDVQLKTTITDTVTAVRNAYWDLVLAVESIDVAKASVDLAGHLVEENRQRVQAGRMTGLDLVTATAQEAADRHALVLAEGSRRTTELALKKLLVTGPDDPLWRDVIDPTDRPDDRATIFNLETAVQRALRERTDLAEAAQQAAANDATLQYLRDQTRPQVDVVATYAQAGLGGAQLLRAGGTAQGLAALTAPVVGSTSGAYGSALSSLASRNYPTWGVALNVSYPIGFSAAKAEAARAQIQAAQVAAQTRQLEIQVVNDVTNAAIQVRNAFDEIGTAKQARDLADQKLDAELKKFTVGLSTNYFVVQAQRDLADARNAVLHAQITYQQALVTLDRAQQTAAQRTGVTVINPASTNAPAVGSGKPTAAAPSGAFFQ